MYWSVSDGVKHVHLSDTLVVDNMVNCLRTVPALTLKHISVIFLPDISIIIDPEDDFATIGYASQSEDGIFYINGKETDGGVKMTKKVKHQMS